uniref:DDE_3 domain-containing protein n=1 Tax=Haemonchus contortus TaxID=6289 RepID=A0A7I4YBX4_HAECO
MCASGKTPLILIIPPGVKIDKDYYLKTILENALLPWTNSDFNGCPWTFQQDLAPARKARVVQAWCKSELPDFISAEEWPASTPDLNPLDYNLWPYLESRTCATPHPNSDSLKAALIREWDEIVDALLRPVIDAFPKRFRAVVHAKVVQSRSNL